ncbi:MAG: protein kinase, partial [Patescibacteria group bacterium]
MVRPLNSPHDATFAQGPELVTGNSTLRNGSDRSSCDTEEVGCEHWKQFRAWLLSTGIADALQEKYPNLPRQDEATSVEIALRCGGMPPSVAHALESTFERDHEQGTETGLCRDLRVTNFAHLGSGATSDVYAGFIQNADALREDAARFVADLLSDEKHNGTLEEQEELVRLVQVNIDRIIAGTGLVVTKVLRMTANTNLHQRMCREMRTTIRRGKQMPNVPPIIGGLTKGNDVLFHMEHLPGADFQRLLDAWGLRPTPLRFNSDVAALAARALALSAEANVIHRDIKPANFFLSNDGGMRTLDLGFVRNTMHQSQTISQEGSALGTPDYISPEAARGEPGIGPATDVFSLGVMLARMYTGRIPYRSAGGKAVQTVIQRSMLSLSSPLVELDFPSELWEGEDPVRAQQFLGRVKSMIQRMIHPDAKQRPSPEEVAEFFHYYSGFGDLTFDEFMNLETYDDVRLRPDPPSSVAEGDFPVFHGYPSDRAMLEAFIQGSRNRQRTHDFLAVPEFRQKSGDTHLSPAETLPLSSTGKPKTYYARTVIGGAAVLSLAALALLFPRRQEQAPDDQNPSVAVQPDEQGKKEESLPAPELPKAPLKSMELVVDANGMPQEFRLFLHESLRVEGKDLLPLYSGSNSERKLCGAGFVLHEAEFARILKLGDVAQIPASLRKMIQMQDERTGGCMGWIVEISEELRCVWITGIGMFIETPEGLVVYFDTSLEMMASRKEEFVRSDLWKS